MSSEKTELKRPNSTNNSTNNTKQRIWTNYFRVSRFHILY